MQLDPDRNPIPMSSARRWLVIFMPAILSLSALAAIFLLQRQWTPDWQVALERYQAAQHEQGSTIEVIAVVTALLPGEFGANEPFRPTFTSNFTVTSPVTGTQTTTQSTPSEVRCVEVQTALAGERQILLLIPHKNVSSPNEWIIYESAGSAAAINKTLAEIGCFFPDWMEE